TASVPTRPVTLLSTSFSAGDGCHEPEAEKLPPSRMLRRPSRLRTRTVTFSLEFGDPPLRANRRRVQSPGEKHIVGVVTELPAGRDSERESDRSWTKYDSLPFAIVAPPFMAHQGA